MRHRITLLLSLCVCAFPARAADLEMGARETAGLFEQACIANRADIKAIRQWMDSRKVPHVPDSTLIHFTQGRPGVGYNASDAAGRYILTSEDNGTCNVYALNVKNADVITALEADLPASQLIRLGDHPDIHTSAMHHYDYVFTDKNAAYNLVVSTVQEAGATQADLTFAPRAANEPSVPVPAH